MLIALIVFIGIFLLIEIANKKMIDNLHDIRWNLYDAIKIILFQSIFFIILTYAFRSYFFWKKFLIAACLAGILMSQCIYFVKQKYKLSIQIIGFGQKYVKNGFKYGITWGSLYFLFWLIMLKTNIYLFYDLIFEKSFLFGIETGVLLLVFFLVSVLLVPVSEEIFFRGFLYQALKRKCTIKTAIIISALFFSFMHGKVDLGNIIAVLLQE